MAGLLASHPPPFGRRVGIVTNAGGPGIMCADACEAGGLEVVQLPQPLRAELARFLPPRPPRPTRWTCSPPRRPSTTGRRSSCWRPPARSTR